MVAGEWLALICRPRSIPKESFCAILLAISDNYHQAGIIFRYALNIRTRWVDQEYATRTFLYLGLL